jgi:hypothetical protein
VGVMAKLTLWRQENFPEYFLLLEINNIRKPLAMVGFRQNIFPK